MSVQEGLVSTALRCLQTTQKAFRNNTQSSGRPSWPLILFSLISGTEC